MEVLNWVFCFRSTVVGPCDNNPCLNGGVCTAKINDSYTCKCASGYSGGNCEIGTCVTAVNSANSHFNVWSFSILDIFGPLWASWRKVFNWRGNHRIWIRYHHFFLLMPTLNTFVTTEKGPDLISNTSFIKVKEWTYLIYDLLLLRSEPMRQETLSKWRNLHRNRKQLAKLSMCRWIFWRKLWKKYIQAYRLRTVWTIQAIWDIFLTFHFFCEPKSILRSSSNSAM